MQLSVAERCLHRRRGAQGYSHTHAAKRDTTVSTLIHATVRFCTRWIRRIAAGIATCGKRPFATLWHRHSHGIGDVCPHARPSCPYAVASTSARLPTFRGNLTTVAQKPSLGIEQATSPYSFRSSELSQPI